jgi:hypothetical protein
MLRLCPQCYSCLKWASSEDGRCDGGVITVYGDCPAYAPVEGPIGVEAETLSLFEEV